MARVFFGRKSSGKNFCKSRSTLDGSNRAWCRNWTYLHTVYSSCAAPAAKGTLFLYASRNAVRWFCEITVRVVAIAFLTTLLQHESHISRVRICEL